MTRHRTWLQAKDGTYYRNANCVQADIRELRKRRFVWLRGDKVRELEAEWDRLFWRDPPTRKARLDRGDVAFVPLPMRIAYPQHPILWTLDEEKTDATT